MNRRECRPLSAPGSPLELQCRTSVTEIEVSKDPSGGSADITIKQSIVDESEEFYEEIDDDDDDG